MRGEIGFLAVALLCLSACAQPQPSKGFFYDTQGRLHKIERVPAGNKSVEQSRATSADWARYTKKNPNQLTINEIDRLRNQLSRCWSIEAGPRFSDELKVEVRLKISRQRKISSAEIVDTKRYEKDKYFRAAADSAIRALNSEHCSPLEVNPSKYDLWKDMIVTFDPSEMI